MGDEAKPLKIREAADRLGVDYGTIRAAIEQGQLIASDHEGSYRIRPDDLAAYREARDRPSRPRSEPTAPAPAASPELEDARSFARQIQRWSKRPGTGKPGRRDEIQPGRA